MYCDFLAFYNGEVASTHAPPVSIVAGTYTTCHQRVSLDVSQSGILVWDGRLNGKLSVMAFIIVVYVVYMKLTVDQLSKISNIVFRLRAVKR